MPAKKQSDKRWLIAIALALLTTTAYWQLKDHSFVNYDDDVYVVGNAHVQSGLSWENVAWAFTSTVAANWHPLTWLSHILDSQVFGLKASGHLLTNLLLHVANVLLLFWMLQVMTGAVWQSALVAALFAVHPINVESVAWVAERKNVLSTLFWLLTTHAYVWYARKPAWNRYLIVFITFVLALMCKPMVVTLPFTLLLLDYWPLNRIRPPHEAVEEKARKKRKRVKKAEVGQVYMSRNIGKLALEKAPLLLLAVLSSVITVKAQQAGGAVGTTEAFPVLIRFENALVSYADYLRDEIWPFRLAVFYPHPSSLPLWQLSLSALALVGVSALVFWRAKQSRYLPVGWLWYLGTLVPAIGVVQVGLQSRADRYAYIPLIGIFVTIAWGLGDWAKGSERRANRLAVVSACVLIGLTVATRFQASYWSDSFSLFQRALAVTQNNYVANNNLGELLAQRGKLDEAEGHFAAALEINPRFAPARHNMGMMLVQRGNLDEAIDQFSKAIEINPKFTDAYNKLGAALASQGRLDEAIANFSKAIEINQNYGSAHANLAAAYEQQGRTEEAIASYVMALGLISDNSMSAQTHFRLGKLLAKTGRAGEAVQHYRDALRLKPDYSQVQQALKSISPD